MAGLEVRRLLERGREVAAIDRLLQAARRGEGGCLVIEGDPGLGKTSLLAEARRKAAPAFQVAGTRADVMEGWLPFGVVAPVIHGLGGPDLLEPFKMLDTATDARATRYLRVLRWLKARPEEPLLLIFDDLHSADADSLSLVAFLARRLRALPVAMLCSTRPWPSQARDVFLGLAADGHAQVEQLAALSFDASCELITDRVGEPVAGGLLGRAYRLCAGNPLLLEQVSLAIERGQEVPEPGEKGPPIARGLLLSRFAGLPAEALRLATAGSVLGGTFSTTVSAEMTDLFGEQARAAIRALSHSGLARSAGGSRLEFMHPLFAQTLYEDLAPAERALLHRRAFQILLRQGLENEAAGHAVQGELRGDGDAITLLERAGRRALRGGALAAAVADLEAAVTLAGDHVDPRLLLLLGDAKLATGQVTGARSACARLLGMEDAPAVSRAQAKRLLAQALYVAGESERADRLFEQSVAALSSHSHTEAVAALLSQSAGSWLTRGPRVALELAIRAQRLAGPADIELRHRADALVSFLRLLTGTGSHPPSVEAWVRGLEGDPARLRADVCSLSSVLTFHANARATVEDFEEARRAFTLGLAAADEVGSPLALAQVRISYSSLLTRTGHLHEALALARRAALASELFPFIESFAAAGQAHILQLMGRLDESADQCRRAEAAASHRGQTQALLLLGEVRGHRALREGRLREAAEHYQAVEQLCERIGNRQPGWVAWARHAVTAYAGCGLDADARRVTAWLERCASELPCRWTAIAAASCRGLLAERDGEHDAAAAAFDTALNLHGETRQPVEEAETLLMSGSFLRRTGRTARARDLLVRAQELAQACGAMWISGFAGAELAVATGGRRRNRPLRQLTPQEHRVMNLAAAGLSNREIADRLCLTIATIETHLQHVFAKLEIHSRRELIVRRQSDPVAAGPRS